MAARFVLILSLLVSGCAPIPYNANQLPAGLVVSPGVALPNDTQVAIYIPESFLLRNFRNPYTQEIFDLGAAMGNAIGNVQQQFFPTAYLTANNLQRNFGLLLDIDPDWEVSDGVLRMQLDYQVLDASQQVVLRGSQSFNERINYASLDTSFYNAAVRVSQHMFVDVVNRLTPSAARFPATAQVADVPPSVLANLESPIRRTTALKLNPYGELLSTAYATEGCLVAQVRIDGEQFDVAMLEQDALLDVSVLTTGLSFDDYLRFSRQAPLRLGEQTLTVSFNRAGDKNDQPLLSHGNVHSVDGISGSMGVIQVASAIRPGSAGAAVLDAQGNLAGFVNGNAPLDYLIEHEYISDNVFFAQKPVYLARLFDLYGINYSSESRPLEGDLIDMAQAISVPVLCYQ